MFFWIQLQLTTEKVLYWELLITVQVHLSEIVWGTHVKGYWLSSNQKTVLRFNWPITIKDYWPGLQELFCPLLKINKLHITLIVTQITAAATKLSLENSTLQDPLKYKIQFYPEPVRRKWHLHHCSVKLQIVVDVANGWWSVVNQCCMDQDLDLSGTQMMLQAKKLSINLYLSGMLLHSAQQR